MQRNAHKSKTGKGRQQAALFPPAQKALIIFAYASVFLFGLYHYWCALLGGAFLTISLIHAIRKKKPVMLPLSLPAIFICIVVLFYFLSIIWAVDKGMALLGALKYLPVPLFMAATATLGVDKERLLKAFANAGGASVAACLALCVIPQLRAYIFPDGRFSGTFMYANSYGLFLLACLVIIGFRKPINKQGYALCAALGLGISLTGSRSLLVLAAASAVMLLFVNWRPALAAAAGVLPVAALSLFSGMAGPLQRSTDISFTAGEGLTRLAYYNDGVRLIIIYQNSGKH